MTRVEVVATDECATCAGTKIQCFDDQMTYIGPRLCPTCGGTGETRTVVTCGGCRHWERHSNRYGYCPQVGIVPRPDFGCLYWQAKETT